MMNRFNVWATMLVGRITDLKDERGQTAVEYSLILAVVVVGLVTVAIWGGLDDAVKTAVTKVTTALSATIS